MEHKTIQFEVVQTTNPCCWKWIVFLDATRMTGISLTSPVAVQASARLRRSRAALVRPSKIRGCAAPKDGNCVRHRSARGFRGLSKGLIDSKHWQPAAAGSHYRWGAEA